jgi:ribosomal protein L11 methylase PrmA
MTLKSRIKTAMFGPPGERARQVPRGLLKGLQFNVDTANKSMRLMGLDETEVTGWTRKLALGAATAVDVGTNDGWYAVYFASRPHIDRVFGFEPDPALVRQAQDNLGLNASRCENKATISAKLVGDQDDAKWCRLDTVLADEVGPIVMKIDVDGGEVEVLKGAHRVLRSHDCRLVIETHTVELERDCQKFLQELGYQTRMEKQGWYRLFFPENRGIPHNQWLIAWKRS